MINDIARFLFRFSTTAVIFALPIGYYQGSDDSTQMMVGVHGGAGQVATYLHGTGCSGESASSGLTRSKLVDIEGSAYLFSPEKDSPFVLGVRGGRCWI